MMTLMMTLMMTDDDFEIKSKIYSFNLRHVLKHICILKMSFFQNKAEYLEKEKS